MKQINFLFFFHFEGAEGCLGKLNEMIFILHNTSPSSPLHSTFKAAYKKIIAFTFYIFHQDVNWSKTHTIPN